MLKVVTPKDIKLSRLFAVTEEQGKEDLNAIFQMRGTAYRTRGPPYILQKEHYEQPAEATINSQETILKNVKGPERHNAALSVHRVKAD